MSVMLGSHVPQLDLLESMERSEYAIQILATPGPSLDELNLKYQTKSAIFSLTCADYINKIDSLFNKQIKFTGQGRQALLNALSFILLAIGCKQNKYYPHLISIIKQQFFKPGVFVEYQTIKRNRILNIIRNIQIELVNYRSICDFLGNNQQFLQAFHHVLNKILQSTQLTKSYHERIEILRKRFNIDCNKVQILNSHAQCWVLGMQRKIYLFEEKQCFIVVSASTSTEPNKSMNESTIQNRIQSQRSISETGQQVILQASEQSTPKFKENQESIRYRKKSHKNSFGGDFQITGYRQLANLVNKSQHDTPQEVKQNKVKKIFSLKFQMQQMGCLTMEQQSPNHAKQLQVDNGNGQNNLNIAKNQIQMRGSHIEGSQGRRVRAEKGQRKKHITSSQIFNLNLINRTNQKKGMESQPEKLLEQEQQRKGQNSPNSINQQIQHENQKHAIYKQQNLSQIQQLQGIQSAQNKNIFNNGTMSQHHMISGGLSPLNIGIGGGHKEHFKLSFSKKDASRFVFKEIQSEYNDNDLDHELQLDSDRQMKIDRFIRNGGIKVQQFPLCNNPTQLLRSSLTNPKSNSSSMGYLSDNDYLKRRQKNGRSLLLDAPISPIQEQVQSSQRDQTEQHSISQSQKQIQNSQQQEQLQQKSNTSYNKAFGHNNANNQWANINTTNKNYINILKTKRKFSYVTQAKNSLFNGNNEELRQSYMEEGNQTISEFPQNVLNYPSFSQNNRTTKNRVSKASKKIHKNSQAVTQSKPQKRRFEQNPISFSQMMIIKDDSNFSAQLEHTHKREARLSINLKVLEFVKENIMCYNQPEGWVRKEVLYYFGDISCDSTSPWKRQRYIIDRVLPQTSNQPPTSQPTNASQSQQDFQQNIPPPSTYSNSQQNITESNHIQKESSLAQIENKSNSLLSQTNQNTNMVSCCLSSYQTTVKNVNNNNLTRLQNSTNKIRSTIDTANTPTSLNFIKNFTNNNVSTPPSSISNLPSQSNPEERRLSDILKNKSNSIEEKQRKESSHQKPKARHKNYKDLQSIHLNLRKNKNDIGNPNRKSNGGGCSSENEKHHPNLQIIYPSSSSVRNLNESFQPRPTITTTAPTIQLLNTSKRVTSPPLLFSKLKSGSKQAKSKSKKKHIIIQSNGKKLRENQKVISSSPHLFSNSNYQGNCVNGKSKNSTTNEQKNVHFEKVTSPQDNCKSNDSNWNNKNSFKNQTMICLNKHQDLTNTPNLTFNSPPHNFPSAKIVKVQSSFENSNQLQKSIKAPIGTTYLKYLQKNI